MKKVYAVDLDGTALKYPELVRKIYEKRDTVVIIHTARPWCTAERTVKELRQANVPYDAIQMEKTKADFYIDDLSSDFDGNYINLTGESK